MTRGRAPRWVFQVVLNRLAERGAPFQLRCPDGKSRPVLTLDRIDPSKEAAMEAMQRMFPNAYSVTLTEEKH